MACIWHWADSGHKNLSGPKHSSRDKRNCWAQYEKQQFSQDQWVVSVTWMKLTPPPQVLPGIIVLETQGDCVGYHSLSVVQAHPAVLPWDPKQQVLENRRNTLWDLKVICLGRFFSLTPHFYGLGKKSPFLCIYSIFTQKTKLKQK